MQLQYLQVKKILLNCVQYVKALMAKEMELPEPV